MHLTSDIKALGRISSEEKVKEDFEEFGEENEDGNLPRPRLCRPWGVGWAPSPCPPWTSWTRWTAGAGSGHLSSPPTNQSKPGNNWIGSMKQLVCF